jgi:hypothetical protein
VAVRDRSNLRIAARKFVRARREVIRCAKRSLRLGTKGRNAEPHKQTLNELREKTLPLWNAVELIFTQHRVLLAYRVDQLA